ncbi:MAG: polysaccharide deacetylase family protein [Acidobacteria bacterium]|nr:polysaccharide deacetylase family protein [Acidobacteriota bacterium]
MVSFTFDDVPRSSCTRGRLILEAHGVRASYYLSMALMDGSYSIGAAFSRADLEVLIAGGHEVGSHTFDHLDAWHTRPGLFEASIRENQRKLQELFPGRVFRTFSFPINWPRPRIKKLAGQIHACCRGGGQAANVGTVDLNLLNSVFLDARNLGRLDAMKKLIDGNAAKAGWLIFSTHDIDERPSPYGCTPGFLEDVVGYARASGAEIRPVYDAWAALCGGPDAVQGRTEAP